MKLPLTWGVLASQPGSRRLAGRTATGSPPSHGGPVVPVGRGSLTVHGGAIAAGGSLTAQGPPVFLTGAGLGEDGRGNFAGIAVSSPTRVLGRIMSN